MKKQDANGVRTAQDLERKYDFAALLGLRKNVEIQIQNLTKVENELNNFINSTLGDIENLQEQIDGKITTWYYEGEPNLNNEPAINWNTDNLKAEHEGDLYYDKSTGYAYRFQLDDTYHWQKIVDQDVVESLAIANSAKDTADSKRQVFITQPITPYDTGDLWITNNEIFICQVSRKSGDFNQSDWINNLKYTDDTVAWAVQENLDKIRQELNEFINSTVGDIANLQGQIDGKITTWYYEGEPNLNNEPAINWNTDNLKAEHEGDLYYDKLTGYAYRFQLDNTYHWQKIVDKDVASSLEIANSAKDTADSKRQVFIKQPTIPYDAGDLWINNNEIFICQESRKSGKFNQGDWINSLKYTDDTVAEQVGESLTVLQGTVQQITKDYVKFTDLSTGGSTTIAGDNVTTGAIKSKNYIANKSGMKIDLEKGTIDTKNTKWDEYGNILMDNGAEVISDKGLLTNLQFIGKGSLIGSHELAYLGLEMDLEANSFYKTNIELLADIPSNFTIEQAYVTLIHQPIYWEYQTEIATQKVMGWSRAIGLFSSNLQSYYMAEYGSGYYNTEENLVEISNAFGSSGWTPSTPSTTTSKVETKKSIDIKTSLKSGQLNKLVITSKANIPSWNTDYFENVKVLCQNTGRVMAILDVIGYMK